MTIPDALRENGADGQVCKYELAPTPDGPAIYRNGEFTRQADNAHCMFWFDREEWKIRALKAEIRVKELEQEIRLGNDGNKTR